MARLEPLNPDDVTPEAKEVLAGYYRSRGAVPNMYRTIARRPEIMRTAAAHMAAVLNTGTVPLRLKEMVVVRVSQVNTCAY